MAEGLNRYAWVDYDPLHEQAINLGELYDASAEVSRLFERACPEEASFREVSQPNGYTMRRRLLKRPLLLEGEVAVSETFDNGGRHYFKLVKDQMDEKTDWTWSPDGAFQAWSRVVLVTSDPAKARDLAEPLEHLEVRGRAFSSEILYRLERTLDEIRNVEEYDTRQPIIETASKDPRIIELFEALDRGEIKPVGFMQQVMVLLEEIRQDYRLTHDEMKRLVDLANPKNRRGLDG